MLRTIRPGLFDWSLLGSQCVEEGVSRSHRGGGVEEDGAANEVETKGEWLKEEVESRVCEFFFFFFFFVGEDWAQH